MKVLVLGANGKVGSRVAARLLEAGHEVIAAIHKNQEHVPKKAVTVKIDTTNQASLMGILTDVDAVVSALSDWHSPKSYVLSTTMKALIPAMEEAGVKRIVSIAGDIVLLPGEKPGLGVRLIRTVMFGPVRHVVKDSERHLHLLYASTLDWTVLRPTIMSSSSNTRYTLEHTHPRRLSIARVAVVQAIVDLVQSGEQSREAPFIHTVRS